MIHDPERVRRFSEWFRERTGAEIDMQQAAVLFAKRDRGELVLSEPLPRKGDR